MKSCGVTMKMMPLLQHYFHMMLLDAGGVSMTTLERGNHPKERPLTGTVTLKQSVEITYLKILTLMTQCKRGREERVQESAMIRTSKAFDPQRSADNTARVKQWTLKPCETSRGHPKGHVPQMGETAGCICSHFNFA